MKKNGTPARCAVIPVAVGGFCVVLGLSVLVDWYSHTVRLLTVFPGLVAMAYNAALGFFLVGISLLAAARGYARGARALALCVVAIGVLTLTEYVSGRSLGIDELFMKEYIVADIINRARMAVCTALCFSLAGTALLLLTWTTARLQTVSFWRQGATGVLGAVIAGLGAVALSGYLSGVTASYAWGQLTRMAVHTAAGFLVLGGGVLAFAWKQGCADWTGDPDGSRTPGTPQGSRPDFVPRWLPPVVGVAVASITLCLWQALIVQQSADMALIRRLEGADNEGRLASLTQTQTLIPLGCLAGGLLLAVLLVWTVYLAQVARRRTAEVEGTNARLQDEIAERHRAEELVAEREKRLTLITDAAPALIAYVGTDQRYQFVNKGYTQMFDLPAAEIIGRTMEEFLGPDAFGRIREFVEAALRGETVTYERLMPYVHTSARQIHCSYTPDFGPDGALRGFVIMVTDITARKDTEEALQRRDSFLRLVTDTVPALIAYVDLEQRYRFINKGYTELFRASEDEILGRPMEDVLGPEIYNALRGHVETVLTGQSVAFETDLAYPSEGQRFVQVAYVPDFGPDGALHGFVILVSDISALKAAEEALRRSNDVLDTRVHERTAELSENRGFLRQVIDAIPSLVFVKDETGRYTLANRATAEWFGVAPDGVVGRTDADLLPEAAAGRFRQEDADVLLTRREKYVGEELSTDTEGRQRCYQTVRRPLVSPDGRVSYLLGVSTDITERKALEAERERLLAQVVQSEKLAALGELVAGVAHEINNPLAAILGNAELLGMHADPQVREDADAILRMSQRANRIVRSLLTFARARDGERQAEDLNVLAQGTLAMAAYKLRKAGVVLVLDLAEPAPTVSVDANEVQQVLLNLVTNAEHALRDAPGPKTVTIKTGTRTRDGATGALLSVTDNGCGMSAEVQSRIFDPFFTTKGIGEGTGLGLSICHGIAQAHGGTLSVESAVGVGTTFTLTLPPAGTDTSRTEAVAETAAA